MKMIRKLLCWLGRHEYKIVAGSMYDIVKFQSPKPMKAQWFDELEGLKCDVCATWYDYAVVGHYKCRHCKRKL